MLLYGTETWKTNKEIERKMRAFEGRCLRNILKVRWPNTTSNKEIERKTNVNSIVGELKRRRWNWLGHVLRMRKTRYPHRALHWIPMGKRKRGRPRGTYRRTIEEEMGDMRKTWRELTWLAQDRKEWFHLVDAFCHSGDEED